MAPLDWPDVDTETEWVASQRRWTRGWRLFVLPTVFLVYLLYVVQSVGENNSGSAVFVGDAILVVFALAYFVLITAGVRVGS